MTKKFPIIVGNFKKRRDKFAKRLGLSAPWGSDSKDYPQRFSFSGGCFARP